MRVRIRFVVEFSTPRNESSLAAGSVLLKSEKIGAPSITVLSKKNFTPLERASSVNER